MKIIFDATILTSIYKKDAARSGIFFASFNIFSQFIKRKDIELFLYADPSSYVEFKKFQTDYYLQEKSLYTEGEVSWFYIALYNWVVKRHTALFSHSLLRKPLALGILIARFFIKKSASRLINYEIANFCDAYFSPVYAIPKEIRKKKTLKCVMLYDAIPLKFPKYYPSGSFLDDIKKTGSSDNLYIFDSHCAREDFKNIFSFVNDENSFVAHLAANEKFTPCVDSLKSSKIKAKYRIPEKKKFIFSLCTLEPRKNLVRAIKTFIQFIEKNNIKDLVWVLGGGHWDSFTKQFNKDIGNSNTFKEFVIPTGYIDDDDLPVLYSNAEWFVYTSQYEGFGLPPLEAMQCGCPVITSNNSSLPEVVGDAGIMIDWDSDEQHIAAYEDYYFNKNIRTEKSRIGLERAKTFSWEKTAKKIIEMMKDASQKRKNKLNIIYRMCDSVSASSSAKRSYDVSKTDLIKKCLLSLKRNVERYENDLALFCIADSCSDDIVLFIKKLFPNIIVERYEKIGNARSFCRCIELACTFPDGEQVCFLEDDYLMLKNNVLQLLNQNLFWLSEEKNTSVAIMPDDYPDRYKDNSITTECRITETGHFLKIDKTTCTFATYTKVVKQYRNTFMKFINWPQITENETINKVWKKIPLYQPIPAWTLHCQLEKNVPMYLDFNQIKKSIETIN